MYIETADNPVFLSKTLDGSEKSCTELVESHSLQLQVERVLSICDPVQQKGHDVGQVYSEIMSKTVCKI